MGRKIITLLTVGIWIGILVAGLSPFNFVPKNGVRWLPDGAGLHFDGHGQLYSSAPMLLPKGSDGVAGATIELVFTPSKPYYTANTVFALVNHKHVSFAIGQSLTDLFLQGPFTSTDFKPVPKLWINRVCGHAQDLFVTVIMDARHVDVYLDGQLARSFPVTTRMDNLSGEIYVGHSVEGHEHWSGSVSRLALLEGALDAKEISRRYELWTKTRHLDSDADHRGAEYDFVTPTADYVKSAGAIGPDLKIPKNFRVLSPTVLEWPARLNDAVVADAVVNIVGFIPFGLVTCLCLRLWTVWSTSRCVAMTILAGAFISLTIELLQVLLPTRDSSLADVITNIMGTVIGAGVAAIGKRKPIQTSQFSS